MVILGRPDRTKTLCGIPGEPHHLVPRLLSPPALCAPVQSHVGPGITVGSSESGNS